MALRKACPGGEIENEARDGGLGQEGEQYGFQVDGAPVFRQRQGQAEDGEDAAKGDEIHQSAPVCRCLLDSRRRGAGVGFAMLESFIAASARRFDQGPGDSGMARLFPGRLRRLFPGRKSKPLPDKIEGAPLHFHVDAPKVLAQHADEQ